MKSEKVLGFLLAAILALLPAAAMSGQDRKISGETSGAGKKSLLRKELLSREPGEAAAPLRDIFRPGSFFQPHDALEPGGDAKESSGPGSSDQGTVKAAATVPFILDYIGYVLSSSRTIALIVLDGQAKAVVEGEEILPGVKVARVDPEKIEIEGPGASKSSFLRQGEQP